jgi:FKBP-type peptidyl-prolyl cis-trans isomerase FkpA
MKGQILFGIGLAVLLSCDDGSVPEVDQGKLQKDLIALNHDKRVAESDSLAQYVTHKGWQMTKTKTGLYYEIVQTKNGPAVQTGQFVSVFYKVFLLDGTLCYDNSLGHPFRFKVGEDHVESGLHELMPLLKVGDEVRVVMPSHLAFGFTGDSNRIPGDSPLYYELKIVTVQ